MKICTDSLIFGAMTPVKAGDQVLDIGTGTGLLSLMAAQLGAAEITAVELNPKACQEACHNFSQSPWTNRLTAVNTDIQSFQQSVARHYDLIISNPPFFAEHLKSGDIHRQQARHTGSLPFQALISAVDNLLSASGLFYVLLPVTAVKLFTNLAQTSGLYPTRQIHYQAIAGKPPKVAALCFSRKKMEPETETLLIYQSSGVYTPASSAYLQPFLLRFINTKIGGSKPEPGRNRI